MALRVEYTRPIVQLWSNVVQVSVGSMLKSDRSTSRTSLAKDGGPTAIDLFAGAGGLSVGFRNAGFNVLVANDLDPTAAATYQFNSPDTRFLLGPIQGFTAKHFLDVSDLREGELDVLVGGPPCQTFSVYNHRRGMHDQSSGLFRDYLRIVRGLMPSFVALENVPGIASVDGGRVVDEIVAGLTGLGYYVTAKILKAEEYGVPQERRRIFFLASRDSTLVEWPHPSYAAKYDMQAKRNRLKPLVTVSEAIGDLPPLESGEGSEQTSYTSKASSDYQRLLRGDSKNVFNHVAPQLSPINLERIPYIPNGGSWRDIPFGLLPSGMKLARRSDHTKRYGRLHPDRQASTILTKCDPHWGAFIHHEQDRAITVREAARFQSFPDSFRFLGSRGEQYKQAGNAVPPLLAQAIAEAMLSAIRGPSLS